MSSGLKFTKQQRYGVLGLLVLLCSLIGGVFWLKRQSRQRVKISTETDQAPYLQNLIDSLKKTTKSLKPPKIYPFNPNFITDYKGYKLGMSPEEIDRLHNYREQDKWVNSAEEFKEVTQISDSLLNTLSGYFKFPDWVVRKNKRKRRSKPKTSQRAKAVEKRNINKANIKDLQKISGIGPVLSKRIVRYRRQIDGFKDDIQLKDVYGLHYEVRNKLLARWTVKDTSQLKRQNINEITTAQLTEIPYFSYELARKITDFRSTHEGISSFEELAEIDGFPFDRMERIKLYLKLK